MTRFTASCLILTGVLLTGATVPLAQGPGQGTPLLLSASVAGKDSFEAYCAPCHGGGGLGDGPVAPALTTRPADLTALARRNNGSYPGARVRDFIAGTGRTLAAHGTTEMPIWGSIFRAFESDAVVRQRIQNVVTYIGSLQAPTTAPDDAGSRLFRVHCASCHGSEARGNGPVADSLRRPPPDLTKFTARNGGVFPSERLYQIIDGRYVPPHGDREMPVWGDVFKYSPDGLDAGSIKARIDALVRYLAGIQERAG